MRPAAARTADAEEAPADVRRRAKAAGVDLALIGLLPAALALGAARLRSEGRDVGRFFRDPRTADLAQCAVTVLPTALWWYAWEARPVRHATPGKRAWGLTVRDRRGARPSGRRVAVRTAVKLLPWQLAHLSVTRAVRADGADLGRAVTAGLTASMVLPAASAALAVLTRDGRALHDRVAGTRVTRAVRHRAAATGPVAAVR
jgi:uncharacterized RDD family membrane protein YckC